MADPIKTAMAGQMDSDKPVFDALLTPHRSIGPAGIRIVVLVFAALAAVPAAYLVTTKVWPLVFVLIAATLSLWLALSISHARGRAFEEVTLWRHHLKVRHVTHKGREYQHGFNPFWVRFDIDRNHADQVSRMTLKTREETVEIGAFLNPDDKASFADAFGQALWRTRA